MELETMYVSLIHQKPFHCRKYKLTNRPAIIHRSIGFLSYTLDLHSCTKLIIRFLYHTSQASTTLASLPKRYKLSLRYLALARLQRKFNHGMKIGLNLGGKNCFFFFYQSMGYITVKYPSNNISFLYCKWTSVALSFSQDDNPSF